MSAWDRYDIVMNELSNTDAPVEKCDGGDHDLYEPVTRFIQGYVDARGREHENHRCYWCPDCRRQFTTNTNEDHTFSIGRAYWELTTVERCDCGHFRWCQCP